MTFQELGLKQELVDAVSEMGFENPTEIQEKAIPVLLSGESDFVGLAQTGTGKTAAFGLPMLDLLDFDNKYIQGLVIAPTRELCVQITKDLKAFSKNMKGAHIVPVYGGAAIGPQIRDIKKGARVVCATPGRLQDMIQRDVIRLDQVHTVVLDEADEMLNMGFKEDIFNILSFTPEEKNTWLFSATMPNDVIRIRKEFMANPAEVQVGKRNQAATTVGHQYYVARSHEKYDALKRLLDFNPDIFGIVFCRTKRDTQAIAEKLMNDGYNAEPLHGDLSQDQRDRVMNLFRNRTLRILVATDVAARGIDVDSVTHVIHMGIPDDREAYNHRSGRTGRAGKQGVSMAIIGPKDQSKLREVERLINKKIEQKMIPNPKEICDRQLIFKMNTLTDMEVDRDGLAPYMSAVKDLFSDYSRDDLLEKLVANELQTLLKYYDGAGDMNVSAEKSGRRDRERKDRGDNSGRRDNRRGGSREDKSPRLFINVGSLDGVKRNDIFKLIVDNTTASKNDLGPIRLMDKYTFVDLRKDVGKTIIKKLSGKKVNGRKLNVEYSTKGKR